MEKIMNWVSIIAGTTGGIFAYLFGGFDELLIALTIFVVADYITGVIKAIFKKQLSSEIGFKGILKKLLIFIVIIAAMVLQGLVDNAIPIRDITVCFYLANEGISLLENIAEFLPVPEKLKEILMQIRDKKGE